ncbi:MAG: hypothetical protein K8E24_013440, partial [Methanobacterium paludis]|nr:hypothetical protein [Methanobacterium paludis]
MYDLEVVKSTMASCYEKLTDPYVKNSLIFKNVRIAQIGEKQSLDDPLDPIPILADIIRGEPDFIGLLRGPLGLLIFQDVAESQLGVNKRQPINAVNVQPRRQSWQATVTGALILFVSGDDDDADVILTHYSDVISDFHKNQNGLNLTGVQMYPVTTGKSINYRPITVPLENTQKPHYSLTA